MGLLLARGFAPPVSITGGGGSNGAGRVTTRMHRSTTRRERLPAAPRRDPAGRVGALGWDPVTVRRLSSIHARRSCSWPRLPRVSWGGEEFAVLLGGRSLAESFLVLEAARAAVAREPSAVRARLRPRKKPREPRAKRRRQDEVITVSIGAAESTGRRSSLEQVIRAADQALTVAAPPRCCAAGRGRYRGVLPVPHGSAAPRLRAWRRVPQCTVLRTRPSEPDRVRSSGGAHDLVRLLVATPRAGGTAS